MDILNLPAGTGVMLCGHGSRNRRAVEEFSKLAQRLRARLPGVPVEYGYLEFADPVLHQGLDRLRAAGARKILAVPGMLFAAGHAKNDIPSVLNTYAGTHPGVEITYGRELGVDLKMLRAAGDRIEQALGDADGGIARAETLLMVDSDMIANRTTLVDGLALLGRVNGLLSLYNSIRHKAVEEAGELVYKQRLGNAGTIWNRELVALVRAEVEPGNFMDDRYCDFLRRRGLQLASTRRSRLQHLGHGGQNNRYFGDLDHGEGFVADGAAQQAALAEAYDELMSRQPFYRAPGVQPAVS